MRNFSIVATVIIGLSFVLSGSSCDDSPGTPNIVGKWKDSDNFHGWEDNFEIEEDLEGEGEFWVYYDGTTVYYSNYDLEAEKDGDVWVIDAESDDGAEYDFEMECERDGDDLDCECSDGFCGDYEWTFEED